MVMGFQSDQIVPVVIAQSTDSDNSYLFTKAGNVFTFVFNGTKQTFPYTITNANYLPKNSSARGIVCNGDVTDIKRAYVNSVTGAVTILGPTTGVGYYGEIVWIRNPS